MMPLIVSLLMILGLVVGFFIFFQIAFRRHNEN